MTMWQRSAPSNQTTLTHQHTSWVEDSPSNLPGLLEEETLECQAEYPQEVADEVEEEVEEEEAEEEVSLLQHQHNKYLLMEETNSLAIRHSLSQETARNRKNS